MTRYWGVFVDETRCEFGASIEANNKAEAWRIAAEDYPESKCVQLESPEETAERERLTYLEVCREMDGDDYYDGDDYDDVEPAITATYRVQNIGTNQWHGTIDFSNGDTYDLGIFDNEDAARASAEQWLDEYETLAYED